MLSALDAFSRLMTNLLALMAALKLSLADLTAIVIAVFAEKVRL